MSTNPTQPVAGRLSGPEGATALYQRWRYETEVVRRPSLAEMLACAQDLPPEQLGEVLLADMGQRLEQGNPILAAQYLEQYPKLKSSPTTFHELVLCECEW